MGDQDKGLMLFGGRPIVQTVIERLRPQVGQILISANRNLADYRQFGYPVIQDRLGGYQGPLAGLHQGLSRCSSSWLLSVPCDGPFVPADLVETLMGVAETTGALAVVPDDGRWRHHTYALIASSLLADLTRYLQDGGRRYGAWLERHPVAWADYSHDPDAFRNLNTVAEFLF